MALLVVVGVGGALSERIGGEAVVVFGSLAWLVLAALFPRALAPAAVDPRDVSAASMPSGSRGPSDVHPHV